MNSPTVASPLLRVRSTVQYRNMRRYAATLGVRYACAAVLTKSSSSSLKARCVAEAAEVEASAAGRATQPV
jgi:hypothetical protein